MSNQTVDDSITYT